MLLHKKVAVLTGAASQRGIGRTTAQMFAEYGAQVAILDRDESLAEDTANTLCTTYGSDHMAVACDVTNKVQCDAVIAKVLAEFDQIDCLINVAGITQPLKIMDIEAENYDAVTDVNLRGTMYMSQAVIPHMRQRNQGSIICISSVSAQRGGGIFGGPHYAAAKAGVLGLTKAMARELGPDNIRVNAIAPGLIDTDIVGNMLDDDEVRADINAGIPLGRVGQPADVAGACLYLASDLSTYVTGTVLNVNGGMLIY